MEEYDEEDDGLPTHLIWGWWWWRWWRALARWWWVRASGGGGMRLGLFEIGGESKELKKKKNKQMRCFFGMEGDWNESTNNSEKCLLYFFGIYYLRHFCMRILRYASEYTSKFKYF